MSELPNISVSSFEHFDLIGHPVWLFEPDSLRILAANGPACKYLGFTPDEIVCLTIADIRPEQDRVRIREEVDRINDHVHDAGQWQLICKDGQPVLASFNWRVVAFEGQKAILATIRDVSLEAQLSKDRNKLSDKLVRLHKQSHLPLDTYRAVFEALPGQFLILEPGAYRVLAASNAYMSGMAIDREAVIGKSLLEIFRRDNQNTEATDSLKRSLQRVERFKISDSMPVDFFPGSDDQEAQGKFWSCVNAPVLDADGELQYLVHYIQDFAPSADTNEASQLASGENVIGMAQDDDAEQRSGDIQRVLIKAQEQAARMRTAERLLDLGAWEYDIDSELLNWSPRVYEIYGLPEGKPVDFSKYVESVDPDDREQMLNTYREFIHRGLPELQFAHRVRAQDGSVRHVRGVGERVEIEGKNMVVGYVQDITSIVGLHEEYEVTRELLQLAGEKVRLGGWRYELGTEKLVWTPGMAEIRGLSSGTTPTLDKLFSYYVPEDRERVRQAYRDCAYKGVDVDEVCQIITMDGERIWVRSIGIAITNDEDEIIAIHGALQDVSVLVDASYRAAESERKRLEVLENISDAFFKLDSESRFTDLNSNTERLFGKSRQVLLGSSFWELFSGLESSGLDRAFQLAVKSDEVQHHEEYLEVLDAWFQITIYPLDQGDRGIAVYCRNISLEKYRQQNLHLLQTAVEHLNDIVLITDADVYTDQGPRIVYANAAFERITGFSKQEVIGKTPRILQGEETDREELDRLKARLQASEPVRVELINYRKSGEKLWLELNIVPLFDENGVLTNFVAIERDNTEKKKTEAARMVIEERFQFVAMATSDVIWDWDINKNRIWWSDGLSSSFGIDPGKLETGIEAWTNHIPEKDRRRVLDYLRSVLEGNENNWEVQYELIRGDGQCANVCSKGFVIRDRQGKALRVVGNLIDQTGQHELEKQVRESQKLEVVGQLTGGVAHDFNNLLTVVLGSAEELRDRLVDETQLELADMVVSASQRAADLTSRLLAFARRQVLRPKILDANQQLDSMEPILVRALGEDIDISITRADELWMIDVDPGQLEVAILNLAINARHAMPQGGHLSIETVNRTLDAHMTGDEDDMATGDYVCISVSDDGEGMDPDTLQKAFEPFFTTKEAGQGSGLGLSMVYGFAMQSNGYVKIYSEQGVGTTIKLFFPRVDMEPALAEDTVDVSLEISGNEHILVVEDDELVRGHLISVLEKLGYRVSQASDGAQALSILESHDDIELLFTDVVLPGGMSGPQIAEASRSIRPDLRVLFTSGYPASAMTRDGRIGANVELLGKPYRRLDLAKTVRKVLDS